jgi:26S proteasome regulatory subunit N5
MSSSNSANDGAWSSDLAAAPALAAKKDFSEDLQALLPESVLVASRRGLDDALALLLPLEKKCRASNDTHTLKQLCLHMVRLCRERNAWSKLNATLSLINKRRNQSKFAISAVVEEALMYVEQTPGRGEKVALIETLKEVCEGKMYLEAESARLHLLLALIFESEGRVGDACDIIQDVHVETYGSLSRREKAEYIIQQVRLNLRRKDFVRALIHSRKMNRRTLEESGGEAALDGVKVAFYSLMVEYHLLHGRDYWEVANCYYKVRAPKVVV